MDQNPGAMTDPSSPSPSEQAPSAPRVGLRIDDPQVRQRILDLLAAEHLEIELLEDTAEVEQSEVDLVVATEPTVDRGLGDLMLGTDGSSESLPGLLVLSEDVAPSDVSRLVADGASGVLDQELSDELLVEHIGQLAEAESAGGLDGPETAGSGAEPQLADFRSLAPGMRNFVDLVGRVADSAANLLLRGETGVGKERLARAVHRESGRRDAAFVDVNCGALPDNLLESELFGHRKGAFTGADQDRKGRFELADGGTIFLDEIGEMPLALQVKLLTVLQRREIQRLGDERTLAVDVRVIAATNLDLDEAVERGEFREDLLYRLRVVELLIPPLRERIEDLPQLAGNVLHHFRSINPAMIVESISPAALAAMSGHDWPGNVRELINVIERAALIGRSRSIQLEDLPAELRPGAATSMPSASQGGEPGGLILDLQRLEDLSLAEAKALVVAEFEEAYLRAVLAATHGKVGETAERAGINPRTLYDKMKRYGLDKSEFS